MSPLPSKFIFLKCNESSFLEIRLPLLHPHVTILPQSHQPRLWNCPPPFFLRVGERPSGFITLLSNNSSIRCFSPVVTVYPQSTPRHFSRSHQWSHKAPQWDRWLHCPLSSSVKSPPPVGQYSQVQGTLFSTGHCNHPSLYCVPGAHYSPLTLPLRILVKRETIRFEPVPSKQQAYLCLRLPCFPPQQVCRSSSLLSLPPIPAALAPTPPSLHRLPSCFCPLASLLGQCPFKCNFSVGYLNFSNFPRKNTQ